MLAAANHPKSSDTTTLVRFIHLLLLLWFGGVYIFFRIRPTHLPLSSDVRHRHETLHQRLCERDIKLCDLAMKCVTMDQNLIQLKIVKLKDDIKRTG